MAQECLPTSGPLSYRAESRLYRSDTLCEKKSPIKLSALPATRTAPLARAEWWLLLFVFTQSTPALLCSAKCICSTDPLRGIDCRFAVRTTHLRVGDSRRIVCGIEHQEARAVRPGCQVELRWQWFSCSGDGSCTGVGSYNGMGC